MIWFRTSFWKLNLMCVVCANSQKKIKEKKPKTVVSTLSMYHTSYQLHLTTCFPCLWFLQCVCFAISHYRVFYQQQCRWKDIVWECGDGWLQHSLEVQDFTFGTAPPMLGLQRTYWSMEDGSQVQFFPPDTITPLYAMTFSPVVLPDLCICINAVTKTFCLNFSIIFKVPKT